MTMFFSELLKILESQLVVLSALKRGNILQLEIFWHENFLPTGFGRSLIYQTGTASILVISPLNSTIRDQLDDMKRQGYSSVDTSVTSLEDIRKCSFKIAFASAELARKQSFRNILKDKSSLLHQNIVAVVVDESHTVDTWTGKRYSKSDCSYCFEALLV